MDKIKYLNTFIGRLRIEMGAANAWGASIMRKTGHLFLISFTLIAGYRVYYWLKYAKWSAMNLDTLFTAKMRSLKGAAEQWEGLQLVIYHISRIDILIVLILSALACYCLEALLDWNS
jgi:hypothetical protein